MDMAERRLLLLERLTATGSAVAAIAEAAGNPRVAEFCRKFPAERAKAVLFFADGVGIDKEGSEGDTLNYPPRLPDPVWLWLDIASTHWNSASTWCPPGQMHPWTHFALAEQAMVRCEAAIAAATTE